MLYRAASPDSLLAAPLDAFTAVFHRASGITHLLTDPVPQILEALGQADSSLDALLAHLHDLYDLPDGSADALAARLDELIAAGLVTTA